MCTLLIYRRRVAGIALVVAANRDELYSRPRGSFGMMRSEPPVIGGIDPEGGGTWLAVSSAGFVAAVTNARLGARRRPEQRSRGLLARDLVFSKDFGEARRRLVAEDLTRYAAVNVVVADESTAVVGTNLPSPRLANLAQPRLGFGNRPAFEPDERIARLLKLGAPQSGETQDEIITRLMNVMSRHEPPSACHHLAEGGTVSSTIMVLHRQISESTILYAGGPPCTTAWQQIDLSKD